jgi:hypothetical protein
VGGLEASSLKNLGLVVEGVGVGECSGTLNIYGVHCTFSWITTLFHKDM